MNRAGTRNSVTGSATRGAVSDRSDDWTTVPSFHCTSSGRMPSRSRPRDADCQLSNVGSIRTSLTLAETSESLLCFPSRHGEPLIFGTGHHEDDGCHALPGKSDEGVDVGISRPRRWKTGGGDVDRADLLSVLGQAAHQRAELRFVIDAAQLRGYGGIVRKHPGL